MPFLLFKGTDYLADTTATLVLKLLEIRKMSFESAIRFAEQYSNYNAEGVFMEHPLEFFQKNPNASDIFTAGRHCEKSIPMGFTLMLKGESPRNIFRILMTRKWQRNKLQGLIYNYVCSLRS